MRISTAFLAFVVMGLAGCSRPTTEDCRKAVLNLQRLRGLDTSAHAPDPEAAVRRCKSTARTETVKCLIAARTVQELDACEPSPHTK